jgi:hypothetical protein
MLDQLLVIERLDIQRLDLRFADRSAVRFFCSLSQDLGNQARSGVQVCLQPP